MFFEGSEKKAEVVINKHSLSLLNDLSDDFWHQLVACCNAKVLSSIENKHCKAFILSESSLFVWEDRFLILTCGVTQLVYSIEYFIKHINAQDILQVTYQRKNEYYSNAQLSSFNDDIQLLSKYVKGKAYRFGEMYSHHNYIFHQDNSYQMSANDKSYELIAYQISDHASQKLTTVGLTSDEIRTFLQLDRLLSGYILDDFVFQPFGYSINAIKGEQYLTIHITPQASSSYVSIQANINLLILAPEFLSILAPKSIDLLSFNETDFSELSAKYLPTSYISKSRFQRQLSNNCLVCFANYIQPQLSFSQAQALDINGEQHAL